MLIAGILIIPLMLLAIWMAYAVRTGPMPEEIHTTQCQDTIEKERSL